MVDMFSAQDLGNIALWVLAGGNLIAHTILAHSRTPAPNTFWGAVYTALEKVGGVYGLAKEVGVNVPTQEDMLRGLINQVLEQRSSDSETASSPSSSPSP